MSTVYLGAMHIIQGIGVQNIVLFSEMPDYWFDYIFVLFSEMPDYLPIGVRPAIFIIRAVPFFIVAGGGNEIFSEPSTPTFFFQNSGQAKTPPPHFFAFLLNNYV